MRSAVIAITKHGSALARRIAGDHYIAAKFRTDEPAQYFETSLEDLTSEIWRKYEALVYLVPLEAVVRTIAPLLKDKQVDPAVIVVDDKASFAITVLSGRAGGTNELTAQIAASLGAQAVVTTASNVGQILPVDILGSELGWTIEQPENITRVSAAVVDGQPVAFVQEAGERNWWRHETPLPENIRQVPLEKARDYDHVLIVTDRLLDEGLTRKAVVYRPKSLVLGIGCDRGAMADQLEEFVHATLASAGLSVASVRNVATVDLKQDEPGLVEFCARHNFELACYSSEQLERVTAPNPSTRVKEYVGTPGVSEPAAMLSSGGELIVPKQKAPMMTLAVARVSF